MKSAKIIFVPLLGLLLVLGACTGSPASAPIAPSAPAAAVELPASPPPAPVTQQPAIPEAPVSPVPVITPQPAPAATYNGLPYGINLTQTPAPLVLSNLTINPPGMRLFGTSNVSVVVTNTGTLPVNYAVTLKVRTASGTGRANIAPSDTQMVNLAGGESKTVSFTIGGLGNGTHIVYIDQLWDRVSVDSQV